ncbi:MAG: NUDIX hydrolase [Magnetococcales bacterium]|nr:NUDIX hydrolase [Magnetococcales bacterium]
MDDGDQPPFRVLVERTVFTNTCFDINADRLRDEGGREVPDFVVVSPKARNREGFNGAIVLPLIDGRFVLLRMFRHPVRRWGWEAPGGFCDAGESAAQTALRELREETALTCPPDALLPLGWVAPAPGVLNARVALFAAPGCRPVAEETAEGELGLAAGRHSFSAAEMAVLERRGELEDAATLIAFHRYMTWSTAPRAGGPNPDADRESSR